MDHYFDVASAQDLLQSSHSPKLSNVFIGGLFVVLIQLWIRKFYSRPLAKVPGPLIAKLTPWWQIYHSYAGDEFTVVQRLHRKYGKVVRVGPNTVDIADGAALAPIYVDKGGFLKTLDYHNFYLDGFPTIFSSTDPAHRASKAKLVAPLFSNAAIRQDSHIISECAGRFVQRLQDARKLSRNRTVELQEHARLLGLDVLASYLFRLPHPAITEKAGSDTVLPWLNAFVDANQFYYLSPRLFNFCGSRYESWRPHKEVEAESAEAVHEYAMSLSSLGKGAEGSFQERLLSHGFSRLEVAAECKDAMFAGIHSLGGVLAATLWHLTKCPAT
ncbi:MAG: hypothetical protein Q9218_002342, partial [Villophora microphyllina]